jgi:hypothetical protein
MQEKKKTIGEEADAGGGRTRVPQTAVCVQISMVAWLSAHLLF